jgi:uncharacterized repeat protein (TIGR01451 family)
MRFGNVMHQIAVVLGAGLLAVGCASNPQAIDGGNWPDGPARSDRVAEAPAPAPAPREPAPAPREREPAPVQAGSGNISAFPTGHTRTPQLLVERRAPAQVRLNEPFEYHYILTNTTDTTMVDVELVEQISSHFQVISSDPAQSSAGTWRIPTLAPGEITTVRVTGRATSAEAVNSCAEARYRVPLCDTVEVVQPALAVVLEGPSESLLCDPFDYRVEVRNTGTGTAENVQVVVNLPDGVQTVDGNRSVTLSAGNLAAGERKESRIAVRAANRGSFTSRASATSGQLNVNSNEVNTAIRQPVLVIECSSPNNLFLGRDAGMAIRVRNTGDAASTNTVVRYTVPANVRITDAGNGAMQGNELVWNIGTLEAGANRELNFRVSTATIGTLATNASVMGDCAEAQSCPLSTEVSGIPAMLLDGYDDPDPIEVGQTTTYTLTVTNQGSADLTNIRLKGLMDEGNRMEFVSADANYPTRAVTGTRDGLDVNFPAISRLAPGQSATFRVVVRAVGAGQVSFRAEAVSNEITLPLSKSETTNFFE